MDKPIGFENDVSEYGVVSRDGNCGEPVKWGHRIMRRLGDERFNELRRQYNLEVTNRDPWNTEWSIIKKVLTLDEAIKMYGPVTKLFVGPRGGSRTIIFTKTVEEVNPEYKGQNYPVEFYSVNIDGDFSSIPDNLVEVAR